MKEGIIAGYLVMWVCFLIACRDLNVIFFLAFCFLIVLFNSDLPFLLVTLCSVLLGIGRKDPFFSFKGRKG